MITEHVCACGCGKTPKLRTSTYCWGHASRGRRLSEETRRKIGESNLGKKSSMETRRKISVANSGKNGPRWKGGKPRIDGGYVLVYMPDHPRSVCNRVLEHIVVVERVLGRPLRYIRVGHPDNEEVHHINFDGTCNHPSNLLICRRQYHQVLHKRIGKAGLKDYFKGLC